ncbi:MAG TPA: hypothetical protein DCR93_17850, partial [Cytophagales bacterium]|nr:hypothetical protein [Cytophagales bacterium]
MPTTKNPFLAAVRQFIKTYVSSPVASRGQTYKKHAIREWNDLSPNEVEYKVQGKSLYTVNITFSNTLEELDVECTCPYGHGCKHSVAALLHWGERMEGSELPAPPKPAEAGGRHVPGKKLGTTLDPFRVKDFQSLNYGRLKYLATKSSRDTYGLSDEGLQHTDAGAVFSVGEVGEYGNVDDDPEDIYEVTLKPEGQDLMVTCTCTRRVTLLCCHAYYVLDLVSGGKRWDLLEQGEQDFGAVGQKLLSQYGLPKGADWKEYFEINASLSGIQYALRPHYAGLIRPGGFNTEALQKATESLPPEELLAEKAPPDRVLGFILYPHTYDGKVELIKVIGKPKKGTQLMGANFKETTTLLEQLGIATTEAESKLELLAYHLDGKDSFKFGGPGWENLDPVREELAQMENLYVAGRTNSYRAPRKKDLQQVRFQAAPPQLAIRLQEEQGLIVVTPRILLGDVWVPLEDLEFPWLATGLFTWQENLYLFESPQQIKLLSLLRQGEVRMAVGGLRSLFEDFLTPLSRQLHIDATALPPTLYTQTRPLTMQCEVYISELHDFIVLKPMMQYSADQTVNALDRQQVYQVTNEGVVHLARDREKEAALVEVVRGLHPKFVRQREQDFFHLTYKEFLDDYWFLEAFEKMQAADIRVLGWNELQKFKYSPYQAAPRVSFSSGEDWFGVEGTVAFGDQSVPLTALRQAMLQRKNYVELGNGTLGLIPETWLERFGRLFRHAVEEDGELKVSTKLFTLIDEWYEEIDDEAVQRQLIERKQKLLHFQEIEAVPTPEAIQATLRPYQQDGYHWLWFLHRFGWGGILADDMGLGKTLQMLTFLTQVLEEDPTPHLLVVPTTLLFNWQREIEKFAPHLTSLVHHGPSRATDAKAFKDYPLIFTTYGTLLSDIGWLKKFKFHYVVLDESQAIKNPTSKRYKAVNLLKARNRIALTGTPIENSTFDLYAQMSFLNPGMLGGLTAFKKEYAQPID